MLIKKIYIPPLLPNILAGMGDVIEVKFYAEEVQPNKDCSVVWRIEEYIPDTRDCDPVYHYRVVQLDKLQGEIYVFCFDVMQNYVYRIIRDKQQREDVAVGETPVLAVTSYVK